MNKPSPGANTPPSTPHLWQDDSAMIPREQSLKVAWWIAVCGAVLFIAAVLLLKPDPYMDIVRFIADGLVVTFQMTVVSMLFALILGLLTGLGRTSRSNVVNTIASLYVEVIRGIPLLVQLFWIYYALSRFIRLGPQVSAVLGLTVCYGAYIGETFRAGIQSIPKGQMEAARALGLTRGQAMQHIIIPQAVRIVLPPVGNEFIAMLKDSSLVSVLAISDMLRRAREYASRTFAYFESYTLVALVYLLVTLIFSRVVYYIEQGMSRENKGEPVTVMHRLAAAVVDFVILDIVGLPILALVRLIMGDTPTATVIGLALMGILSAAYIVGFWNRSGATPGMLSVGLQLITTEGVPPSLSQSLSRLLLAMLPLPGLTLIGAHPSLGGRPFQDRWTQTRVVQA